MSDTPDFAADDVETIQESLSISNPAVVPLLLLLHACPPAGELAGALAMPEDQWASVVTLASDQQVLPYLYWNLQRQAKLQDIAPAWSSRLRASHLTCAARNRILLNNVQEILHAFAKRSLPAVVLKGTYLVDQVYATLGARVVGDTDLLLPSEHIAEAVSILEQLGYAGSQPFSPLALTADKHLGAYQRQGHVIELHYRLSRPTDRLPVPDAEFWERVIPVTIAGAPAMVLGPEDQLLHLCLHGTLEHQLKFDIRFLIDIVAFTHTQPVDWDVVTRRAYDLHWTHSIWLALELARTLMGANIPAEACGDLRPNGADRRILAAAIDRLFAPKRLERSTSRDFARFWQQDSGLRQKIRQATDKVFVPRAALAQFYHLSPGSPWLPFYYAVRARDVAVGALPLAWRLWRGDPALQEIVKQTSDLDIWLNSPGEK